MTILYFGNYRPDYSRNRVLIKGLRRNGIKVIECSVKNNGFRSFISLFLRHLKLKINYDLMVVGFPGQEVMFIARFLTRKPIVFDAFTSHYGGYILDRAYFSKKSWRAKYYRFLDKWSCKSADLVLLDTDAHIDFFVKEFGLPRKKFRRIFVGTNTDIFYPRNREKETGKFIVHFHGHYIPLQGVKYIVEAAKILEKENIIFNLIGRGQTYKETKDLAESLGLKNINFIDNVSYERLPDYMIQAGVCLGVFGSSSKIDLVIPNKIYEALAMGKTVITADTSAVRELLTDGENVFLCQKANPQSLAEKILYVKNNPVVAEEMGQNGWRLFREKLTEKILAADLVKYIDEIKRNSLPK